MTEENRNEEIREEKYNCICHSKGFREFLTIALGSFVGVFCALSLFAALHKPPMMGCPCHWKMMLPPPMMHHQFNRMDKGPRGDFHRRDLSDNFDKNAPVRVNVGE